MTPQQITKTASRMAGWIAEDMQHGAMHGKAVRVPKETKRKLEQYVTSFVEAYPDLVRQILETDEYGWHQGTRDPECAFGLDLFLTAAGHGTGFWDRDSIEDIGRELTDLMREEWRKWHIESFAYRGWLYVETNTEEGINHVS